MEKSDEEFAKKVLAFASLAEERANYAQEFEASNNDLQQWQLAVQVCAQVLGLVARKEQIIAALQLTSGAAVEMATGEGKTLSLLLAAIINTKHYQTQHLAYPTSYLTKRDYEFSKPVWQELNIEVGYLADNASSNLRKKIYQTRVVYSPFSELAFDYLRDQLATHIDELIVPPREVILIDELDAQLLDSAVQPFVISRKTNLEQEQMEFMRELSQEIARWQEEDVEIDENIGACWPTDKGWDKWNHSFVDGDKLASLYGTLKAHFLLKEGRNYFVEKNEIVLIDADTGARLGMRRFSGPVHLALELKHNLPLTLENEEDARTTAAQFAQGYIKIAGCSATLFESRNELKAYGLKVARIKRRTPSKLAWRQDKFFNSVEVRNQYLIDQAKKYLENARPVFIAATSVEQAELLAAEFSSLGIKHNLLTARNEQMAQLVLNTAGNKGQLTIATQSAGRGVDIILPPEAKELGGLAIIAAGHLPGKRADRQLAGRAARGEDHGSIEFLIAPDDLVLRLNRAAKVVNQLSRLWAGGAWSSNILENHFSRLQNQIELQRGTARQSLLRQEVLSARPLRLWEEAQKKLLTNSENINDLIIKQITPYFNKELTGVEPNVTLVQKMLKEFNLNWEPNKSLDTSEELQADLEDFLLKESAAKGKDLKPLGESILTVWLLEGLIELRRRYRLAVPHLLQQAQMDSVIGRKVEHTLAQTTTREAQELERELFLTIALWWFHLPADKIKPTIEKIERLVKELPGRATT